MSMIRSVLRFTLAALAASLVGGCGGPYVLSGRAVEGGFAMAEFVEAGDEQLSGPGVAQASIKVYRDPTNPNRALIARGRSDSSGDFSMELDAFGAGWMEEHWLIEVVKPGYETIEQFVTLPPNERGRRLLVLMRPGTSIPPRDPNELWDEYERYR
jgi:hypothetical protein